MPPVLTSKEATAAWMQDIAPFAILTTDRELRITGWNQWLVTHSTLRPDDVNGRPLLEIFPEIAGRKLDEYFKRALKGQVSVLSSALHGYLIPLPATVRDKAVTKMQQTARIAPLSSNGEVLGTITIIEDVSQREYQAEIVRRQHAREKLLSWALARLLEANDPVAEMRMLFPKVREELGLSGELTRLPSLRLETNAGQNISGTGGDSRVGNDPAGSALTAKCAEERRAVIIQNLQKSDQPATTQLRSAQVQAYIVLPLLMGDRLLGTLSFASTTREEIPLTDIEFLTTLAQYGAIAIDRADRDGVLRQAEQTLRNHADVLEATVTERTRRLHDTISQMESFSYSVAHDLRAPIRALSGYCEVLSEDFRDRLPPEASTIIQRLARSATRLDELTRDLLKFSHLSLQEIDIGRVDLSSVADEIVFLNPALQDGVVSIAGPLGAVFGQRTLVHQCIANLLDNAVKFSHPGRRAEIRISSELRPVSQSSKGVSKAPFNPATSVEGSSGGMAAKLAGADPTGANLRLRVWVEDKGIGIPAEAYEKIFGIFERLSETNVEGTGIGLAIVARAMQQMGGACGLESSVGQGSRFWLEFHPASLAEK